MINQSIRGLNCVWRSAGLKLLSATVLLAVFAAQAQTSFFTPQLIEGDYGVVTNDNSLVVPDVGAPTIANLAPTHTLWYVWTPTSSGEAVLDTIVSKDSGLTPMDTVIGVYTGSDLAGLNLVAANDEAFPAQQLREFGQYTYTFGDTNYLLSTNFPAFSISPGLAYYALPLTGPSVLRFNAKAFETYYIAVDSRDSFSSPPGVVSLNWSLHSSGVFRFATERIDQTLGTQLPLFQGAATESSAISWRAGTRNLNQNGIAVTVTRVAGSTGRVTVNYQTESLTNEADPLTGFLFNGDLPAVGGGGFGSYDFVTNSGTLTFDDNEMSKTFFIQLNTTLGTARPNRMFAVTLTNAQLDVAESAAVSAPRVDNYWGRALVRILDVNIDPKGATMLNVTNIPPGNTNLVTIYKTAPTNSVFNFQRANYRVYRAGSGADFSVYVNRTGTNRSAETVLYSVNSFFPYQKANAPENKNNDFPLSAGSDYASPSPTNSTGIRDSLGDFSFSDYSGSVSWGANDSQPKPIDFRALANRESQFNEDFQIHLYKLDSDGDPYPVGMVSDCNVTIMPQNDIEDARPGSLVNSINAPAGSVDEVYNADYGASFFINTVPPNMAHPGTDGEVYGIALQTDEKAIVVGDFFAYNGTSRGCIARVTTNGYLDTAYAAGVGANDFISSVAVDMAGNALIGGAFTSYNGTPRSGIARLTTNGTVDATFNPGMGVNGTVWAVKALFSGKILIAGDFTSYDGTVRNYLARLNNDGTLDTTFDPGTALTAPVYAIGVEADSLSKINRDAAGADAEDINRIDVGSSSGILTVTYNFYAVEDDMRVFYGGTNDVLIFDTGLVNNAPSYLPVTVAIPFGPTNGLNTNVVTIVMNQGNGILGTVWDYSAILRTEGASEITVGGAFTSVAGVTGQDHIARILTNGLVDLTFNPGGGVNGNVYAIGVQTNGNIIVGGEFSQVNGVSQTRIARLTGSGVLDPTFYSGTGVDDTVYSIDCRTDGTTYIGGSFTSYNGTHRLGFARLNMDGSLDTTFLDTAYNQFAGLTRERFGDLHGTVLASAVQFGGGVLIGGSFDQVGGGQFDARIRPESNTNAVNYIVTRAGIRNRNNFARLIGGGTPGPGNIGLNFDTYRVNKSASSFFVGMLRTNGFLGPASANFSVLPGLAQSGADYIYIGDFNGNSLYYPSVWSSSRGLSPSYFGQNGVAEDPFNRITANLASLQVNIALTGNTNNLSDLSARLQLANPSSQDVFFLGGENIPLGLALGASGAPLSLVENRHQSGVFAFASANYGGSSDTPVAINRSGGTYGVCSVQYTTTTNGSTAVLNSDYRAASGTLNFSPGQTNNFFTVQVLRSNDVSTVEKYVNLRLFNPQGPSDGQVSLGLTNAVLRIINGNFQGYLSLSTNAYNTNLTAGSVAITVTRTVGNKGLATVQVYTVNGTAVSGTDFIGFTNTLTWNNGDVSPRTIIVPLINNGILGGSKQFNVLAASPMLNGIGTPSLFAATAVTNAIVTIDNDTTFGSFQFSRPVYQVNENGGLATLTVVRSGSAMGAVNVDYTTYDGGAISNLNYGQSAGTLAFAPNQLSAIIAVPLTNDFAVNPPPSGFDFKVEITGVSAGATIGSPALTQVQIYDAESNNRPPGDPDVTFDEGSGMNASVLALSQQLDGSIIAGGNFTTVNGTPRGYLARMNSDGTLDANGFLFGLAAANNPIYAIAVQPDDRIVVGGNFTTFNGTIRNRIARVMTDGSLDTSFNPGAGADNTIYAVAQTQVAGGQKIYVGGAFNVINAVASRGIVRLNTAGTVDAGFVVGAGANGVVYAIAPYPTNSLSAGKILIGGAFTDYNNITALHLARLNQDGSADTNFVQNVSVDGNVYAIAILDDGRIVIGGEFSQVNSTAANRIACLNDDGTIDASFAANVNGGFDGSVASLSVQADGRIVVAGDFTSGNGVTRNRLTRLMPDGTVDPTINFGQGANAAINATIIQPNDGAIVIGGAFTKYDNMSHQRIARIYAGSQTGVGGFQFAETAYQVEENGVYASVTVRRTGGTMGPNLDGSGDVTVHFGTADATAIAGINYSNVAVDLIFPPAETFQTVLIPVMNDQLVTVTLSNIMTLSSPSAPAVISGQDVAPLYILNNDSAVSFSSANYSVAKDTLTGIGTITVQRIGTTFGTCSVDLVNTTNGTATVGLDYFPTNVTLVFNPGEFSKTIQVPIINNGLPQGNTTVIFALTNAVGTLLYEPSNSVLTIIDTVNAPGQLAFANDAYTVGEGDGTAYLTVLRTNGRTGIVSVNYTAVAGTAVPGVNYTTASGTLTFGDGVTNKTITVPLVQNGLVQGPLTFSVGLTGPAGGATLISPTNTWVTILDDETGITFASATNLAPENLSFANVTVLRLYNTNGAVSVDYETTNGTALDGIHYTAAAGTLSFTNGETIKTVSIPLIYFTNVTGDLNFGMRLFNPGGGSQLTGLSNTVVVVQDADAGVSFTTNNATVLKNAGIAVVNVVCSNPRVEPVVFTTNDVPLMVDYYTVDGTASAGVDYQFMSGTLVFTNGMATNTIMVPIVNNGLVNGNHTFSVVLTNVTAPGQITPYTTQAVEIVDSNSGLRFSQAAYTAFENGIIANINIFRTGFTDSVVTVQCLVTNGTALSGVNFVATNALVVFTNGVTTRTVPVALIANSQVQPNLIAQLQLLNPTNGILVSPSSATLTILENGGSYVIPAGAQIVSESFAPANGILDSNETVQVRFAFRDSAGLSVTNLNAILLATNGVLAPSAVPVSATNYGPLTVYGHSVSRTFSFTVSGTNSYPITPTFRLYDNRHFIGTAAFNFTVGSWTTAFTNSGMIVIRDNTNASPYPSIISVTNVGNTLIKATVTLNKLAHAYPADIGALVVAPSGTNTLILANVGGGFGNTNVSLTFDDAATNSMSQSVRITTSTNKPTSFFPVQSFP